MHMFLDLKGIKLHFSFHGIFSNPVHGLCFSYLHWIPFNIVYEPFESSNHLQSFADNDMNSVGIPSWRIMAIRSFLLCSKYGGLDQISNLPIQCMEKCHYFFELSVYI